jgi:hypothetical protein
MDAAQLGISCCQRCRYYTPEGRRGGHCGQLNVQVRGKWQACSLAAPVFLNALPNLEEIPVWREDLVFLEMRSQASEDVPLARCS